MIDMFDYKKYSVQEYNDILLKWFLGTPPESTNIFKYVIKSTTRNDNTMLIMFTNNFWIKVDEKGWWCEAYSDLTQDVISNRHFYQKHRTSESLGLGHVAYTSRPAKGITYKNIVLNGVDISRNENRVNVSVYRKYNFNVEKFKKYTEYQFSTHSGLHFYEKVSNKNEVLKCSVRVSDDKNEHYAINIERSKDRKRVMVHMNKGFSTQHIVDMNFKDCGIDNIFNKYLMFDFDLTAEQDKFEIMEKVRYLLVKNIKDTYDKIKEDGENATFIKSVLTRMETIESDEYQIQKRP